MPAVWTPRHTGHAPGRGYWLGVELPGDEEPERGELLRSALEAGRRADPRRDRARRRAGAGGPRSRVRRLDEPHWTEWEAAGLTDEPGQHRVVPYVFALPQVTSGRPVPEPAAAWARSGRYAMDTMTLISPGTYDAARGAIDAALTAGDLALDNGAGAAYAACRPPGHHAGAALYGGSCYLNNAAVTAQYLRDRGAERVAVIDIDAHHGNGTQELFYAVTTCSSAPCTSIPAPDGSRTSSGSPTSAAPATGRVRTATSRCRRAPTTTDWVAAVHDLSEEARRFGPGALVVSLGVDAAAADPGEPARQVTAAGFARAGRALAVARRADRLRAGGRLRPRAPRRPRARRPARLRGRTHHPVGSTRGNRRPRGDRPARGGRRRARGSATSTCAASRPRGFECSLRVARGERRRPHPPLPGRVRRAGAGRVRVAPAWRGRRRRCASRPRPSGSTRSTPPRSATTCCRSPRASRWSPWCCDDGVRTRPRARPPQAQAASSPRSAR